jgi:hypothetical protein
METTINKTAVLKLKESIKNASAKQKWYKNQRKTVHKDCSKKLGDWDDISPDEATWKHSANREILRTMYLAYALLRGRDLSETDRNYTDVGLEGVKRMAEMYEKEAEKKPVEADS